MLSRKEADFLLSERVARMATINMRDGSPHVVPICFSFDGENICTTLHARSRRLKNIREGSKICLLVDRYMEENDEWKVLCGLLIRGNARILTYNEDKDEFMRCWKLLICKYPQYRSWANLDLTPKDADKRVIIRIRPLKIVRWGFR